MGALIIQEARKKGIPTVGAVEAANHPQLGLTLSKMGISDQSTRLFGPDKLCDAIKNADVYISFTSPAADVLNTPIVAKKGTMMVLGTTGFTQEQDQIIRKSAQMVPSVISPNFSIGINILFKLAEVLKDFPNGFDFSINEIHHNEKKDAPSGTAKKIAEIIAGIRGYTQTVHGREGTSKRKSDEIEVSALRAGGVPGIHDIIVAGPYEMLRIEHTAFHRTVFATGAIYAAEWLYKQKVSKQINPGIYSMATVLGL